MRQDDIEEGQHETYHVDQKTNIPIRKRSDDNLLLQRVEALDGVWPT